MNLWILLFRNKPKLRVFSPRKSQLVIYDPVVRDVFRNIIDPYKPTYLALSSEIYLTIFVKACYKKLFQRDERLINLYIIEFLSSVNPTLIGTNFEIDCRFSYFVSNLGWDTFFVQHGNYAGFFVNEEYRDFYKSGNVTDMFVFNSGVKTHMASNFNYTGNFHVIGSLIANELIDKTITSNSNGKYLYFISEWEGVNSDVTALQTQQRIVEYCKKYCSENSMILKILLRHHKNHPKYENEIAFYKEVTAGGVEFKSKESANDNYRNLVNAYGVVFLSSTLGYELMLNEKLSVACISFRGSIMGLYSEVFGWPIVKESRGRGFTNIISYEEISRVLHDLKIGGISNEIRRKLLEFDPKNRTFKFYLEHKLSGTNER